MYKGFIFDLTEFEPSLEEMGDDEVKRLCEYGSTIRYKQERLIRSSLDKYLSPTGSLKASDIENDWFPMDLKADVFLSHSHEDNDSVKAFAAVLDLLGLKPFVDSEIWGYANDLILKLDGKYHVTERFANGTPKTYDYNGSNYAVTHVNMILNGALEKMMNKTECVIFLETPHSLTVKDGRVANTGSPWIYSELLMSKYLVKHIERPILESFRKDAAENSLMKIEYDADISHLGKLKLSHLNLLVESGLRGKSLLDELYIDLRANER